MHALMLTVLTLAAQPGTDFTPAAHTSQIAPVQYTDSGCNCSSGSETGGGYVSGGYVSGGDYGYGGGGYYEGGLGGRMRAHKGPMPQTCYAPRYGCYPGNDRYVHRYPAFHDSYYRRPYAYRHGFEYPWHAELHEPTSLWSYNVPMEEDPYFDREQTPVPPLGAREQRDPEGVRSARRPAQQQPVQQPAPQRLSDQAQGARVMQQGLEQELQSVVRRPSQERGPQPTPAVRPPVLAPIVSQSEAAGETSRAPVSGSNTHSMSDLMQR